jgi:pimeloyl-ACP methyl ester carboxylesterase
MARLADRFRLYAPDLRGFGDSDKPEGPYGPDQHMADMLALMDALGIGRAGVVGHDVGGAVMQPLARKAPERVAGLFFFDFVYPGIGPRMAEPERLNNIWYQSFHQTEMAPSLVGATRESCRAYIGHFLKAWSHRKGAFDDVLEAFTDNFMKSGNLAGGFAHYKAAHAGRVRMMKVKHPCCRRSHQPAFAGPSTIRCFPIHGPIAWARPSPVSISRCFRPSGTFRTARTPIARVRRLRRSSNASIGREIVLEMGGAVRRDKSLTAPCRFIDILAGKCGFAGQRSDNARVATHAETATRSRF